MLVSSEIIIRKSAVVTDTASNGGRMSKHAVTSGANRNFLRDWTLAEAQNGGTMYRKFFLHAANADGLTYSQAGLHLLAPSAADERVALFAGMATDTQADLSVSPTTYGAGTLQAAVAAGATTFAVALKDTDLLYFHDGDTVCLYQAGAATDGSEDVYEYHDNITVSHAAGVDTITLADGDMAANAYAAGDGCASVLQCGDIAPTVAMTAMTSAAGIVDVSGITPDAIAGIDHTVTITFTSATAFSAVSDVLGALGAGTIGNAFAPTNADFTRPYFTIAASVWSGTFAAGDIVTLGQTAAAAAFWMRSVLPAGAAPFSGDAFGLRAIGGSN
ncbi:conserved hypothetical protein [Solidesulfovibrio fructosivorans JJ]]|uniref:Uncharacterized protein n=2 Tax=Solidesulfovibrio fructosivorans TaxID=878 RepID=E1JRB2_SOLFR|nr:conserved hypothetical protein [Solidesulfovibrio fructosivorans JJ]]